MLLTYSANFVLWKFSAMRQSESYISHEAGMHTQLVAILKGIDTRVDLNYFHWFLRYRIAALQYARA